MKNELFGAKERTYEANGELPRSTCVLDLQVIIYVGRFYCNI